MGRSRRRHGAQAVALARAPLRPGQRRSAGAKGESLWGRYQPAKVPRAAPGFDKGTLAMAHIGLTGAGKKPARSADKRTGHRPTALKFLELCPISGDSTS